MAVASPSLTSSILARSSQRRRSTRLTGRDKIAARFMYQGTFEFYPQFKLFIAANDRPMQSASPESGIWRRIHVVPFEHKVAEVDKDLKSRLRRTGRGQRFSLGHSMVASNGSASGWGRCQRRSRRRWTTTRRRLIRMSRSSSRTWNQSQGSFVQYGHSCGVSPLGEGTSHSQSDRAQSAHGTS